MKELQDKRLLNRLETAQQDKFIRELTRHISDSADKYENVDITHEPINLVQKLKGRLPNKFKPAAPLKKVIDET